MEFQSSEHFSNEKVKVSTQENNEIYQSGIFMLTWMAMVRFLRFFVGLSMNVNTHFVRSPYLLYIYRTVELMVFIISLASCVSPFGQTITIAGILIFDMFYELFASVMVAMNVYIHVCGSGYLIVFNCDFSLGLC